MSRKATALLILALILYFFANQTQVGWLYVISALLIGIVLTARFFNRRMLRDLQVTRTFKQDTAELREGDSLAWDLTLSCEKTAFQLLLTQINPLADPDTDQYLQKQFLPQVTAEGLTFQHDGEVYRRGVHTFPPLEVTTRAPFGLFTQHRALHTLSEASDSLLIYPECKQIARLSLFDQRPSVQFSRAQAGLGNEIMGVRPYRTGDSPRHIHWRSVARTGRLVSKEFVDETQPGLAIVLDNSQLNDPDYQALYQATKHNPFETAVKIAASLGDYALRHSYPLHIINQTAPRGPLNAAILWQYLARLEPDNERPFSDNLAQITQTFIAIILPYPSEKAVRPIIQLAQQGHTIRTYLIDPATYPDHPQTGSNTDSVSALVNQLKSAQIEVKQVPFQGEWTEN